MSDTLGYFDEHDLDIWRDSNDVVLVGLYELHRELKRPPTEHEAFVNLTFFIIASIGCRELEADELANTFSMRADKYVAGLSKMGFSRDYIKSHGGYRTHLGMLERIIRHACGMVDHLTKETSRIKNVKLEDTCGSECRADAQEKANASDSKLV